MTETIFVAEPELSLKVLSNQECRILKAVCDRILPQASEVYRMDLAKKIDSTLANVRSKYGRDLKRLLFVFEYAGPVFGFVFKRFTRMNPEEQDHYLTGWERSRFGFKRTAFQVLKRLTLAAFYGSEESWRDIGYRGPWLDQGYPYDYPEKGIQHPTRD